MAGSDGRAEPRSYHPRGLELPATAPRLAPQRVAQRAQEGGARPAARAELFQMRRVDLAVEEVEAPGPQLTHQRNQCDLRSIRAQREHRLAEEGAAQRDAVDAAHQLARLPGLGAVREAEFEKPQVRLLHWGSE